VSSRTSTIVSDSVDSVTGAARAIVEGLAGVLDDGAGRTVDMFDALREQRGVDRLVGALGRLGSTCSSCARPHACWLPDELPAVESVVSPCGTARLCISVRNCGLTARTVFVAATGSDAGLAHGAPSTATVGAFDTAELAAEVTLPEGTHEATLLVWVRGCHDHVMRWTVRSHDRGCASTHHVSIEDCPRTQHHWHDHFAQPHACRTRRDG
jgi:hypothetical protein